VRDGMSRGPARISMIFSLWERKYLQTWDVAGIDVSFEVSLLLLHRVMQCYLTVEFFHRLDRDSVPAV
jgi:hypothetical protein